MKQAFLLCLCITALFGFGQSHCIKLNSTFVLSNQPIGGFGYEFAPDSSSISYGCNVEAGRYAHRSITSLSSTIDGYELFGFGIMPEVRKYLGISGKPAPLGFFSTAFCRVRWLKQSVQEGISGGAGGYQIDSPSMQVSKGTSWDYGVGVGYKTGNRTQGLHIEILVGYGMSHSRLFEASQFRDDFFRIEFLLAGILSQRPAENSEYIW